MPIAQSLLESTAPKYGFEKRAVNFSMAKASAMQTAFLSHSHHDDKLAKGLQVYLKEQGWDVYIDWEDVSLPEKPDRTTAAAIKSKIKQCDWFLFLATQNSVCSRWCPWEIGYADGVKLIDTILIIPTKDRYGKHYGNEYLQLYREIEYDTNAKLAVWLPNMTTGGVLLEHVKPAAL